MSNWSMIGAVRRRLMSSRMRDFGGGQPVGELLLPLVGDGVELALGTLARRAAPLVDAAVADQARQRAVDLPVRQRLVAAEELVVLPF